MSIDFDPTRYGPVIADLLAEVRRPSLGPGSPNEAVRPKLKSATTVRVFEHARVTDRQMAEACLSALWLYHDFLDESHTISQQIPTPTGSYWHGIMHRREPDFANAAYWFRRVGDHPVFPALRLAASESIKLSSDRCRRRNTVLAISQEPWDPSRFIDLCAECHRQPGPVQDLCVNISLAEWRLLFDHSYRHAIGE